MSTILDYAPGQLDIPIALGDALSFKITFTGMNLTAYTIEAGINVSDDTTILMTVTNTDLENGIITLSITSETSATLPVMPLTWYLKMGISGEYRTYIAGTITVVDYE